MQIYGSRSLTPMRNPSIMGGGAEGQRLVFLYPMLFDSTLSSFMNELRDFLSVDFIGQIKIANVLNVTSRATQLGVIGTGRSAVNPAQEVRKALHYSLDLPTADQTITPVDYQSTAAYQDRINSFLTFIRNQLQYDPRYQKLRPMISSIVLQENLINIPLVLGTRAYTSNAYSLYWILIVAMAWGLSLDTEDNLNAISSYLKAMPSHRFIDLLFTPQGRSQIAHAAGLTTSETSSLTAMYAPGSRLRNFSNYQNDMFNNRISRKISEYIQDEVDVSLRELRTCLNISRWEVENNHLAIDTKRISMATIPEIPTKTQRLHFEKSMASFQSYISNSIIPILHSMEYILGPTPTHLNFQSKVDDFLYNGVESLTQNFIDLSNHVTSQIRETVREENGENVPLNASDRLRQAAASLQNIQNICQSNRDLTPEIKRILINELDPIIHFPIRFTADNIGSFIRGITESSSKLKRHSMIIEDWIRGMLRDPMAFNQHLEAIKSRFQTAVQHFFYGPDPTNALYDSRIESTANLSFFIDRYYNFQYVVCNSPGDPSRQESCRKQLTQFVETSSLALQNILYFLYIWNFLSYLCGYMSDVEIDIQVQRRDVLEFPNYCLVLPLDIFKFLYTLQTVSNFRSAISSEHLNPKQDLGLQHLEREDILVNLNNITRMIEIVKRRLKIPNLVVVNRQKNEIYYQFMYMSKPNRLPIVAMQNYVKHQVDILPGF